MTDDSVDDSGVGDRERRRQIVALRGPKAVLDPRRPAAMLVEEELSRERRWEAVRTLFLTGKECPLRCAMCDLWRYTLDQATERGAIVEQIDFASHQLPAAPHIKLYNAGNFFDPAAIPFEDHAAILSRLDDYRTIIVENHPRLCRSRCFDFARRCEGRLEVALGLETIHLPTLRELDKQFTLSQFDRAVERLLESSAGVRAFVLLQPAGMFGQQSVEWSVRTVEYAFERGVDCCAVIPVRPGNGWLDQQAALGRFVPPTLKQLEAVIDQVKPSHRGRLQVDLWDVDKLAACAECRELRLARIREFHRTQIRPAPVNCSACAEGLE